ncbi:deaminase [Kitasatospora sp. NPDC056783]|uniref:deoxycytidylate deaminase n=1 Tax=Kitasatospora sp. NPDC056783 TaxID=3345943 RepID=UPI00367A31ED
MTWPRPWRRSTGTRRPVRPPAPSRRPTRSETTAPDRGCRGSRCGGPGGLRRPEVSRNPHHPDDDRRSRPERADPRATDPSDRLRPIRGEALSCHHRPCWDCYFLGLAQAVSTRGDCMRKVVGAVLVSPDRRVLGTGYNGSAPGQPSCKAGGCDRCLSAAPPGFDYANCIEYHAEWNAILWSRPEDRAGATLYVTFEPCGDCTKLITGVGITRVVWKDSAGLQHEHLMQR